MPPKIKENSDPKTESLVCEVCPTCAGVFVGQITTMRRDIDLPDGVTKEKWEHYIICVKGHRFDIAMRDDTHWLLRVPLGGGSRHTHMAVETREPCRGKCGKPIAAGEFYVGGPTNPKHLGC